MKKFLLGTTALISMSTATAALAGGSHAPAAAAPANTGGLTVMVGGNIDFQSVFKSGDEPVAPNSNSRNEIFRQDTKLNFTAAGSTDSFDYGAVIELSADPSPSNAGGVGDKNGNIGGTKTYIYLENDSFGRFEAGQNVGASNTLEVDASKIARGTGGINGDWVYNLNLNNTAGTGGYLVTPNLPTADEDTRAGNSNKITYYTPRFSGLQFGVSFSPDSGDRGSATGITGDNNSGQFGNVFAGGLNFESDISDGVSVMASLVGETGSAELDTQEDLNAYSVGLGFEFEGFSVAGNWADLSDSGVLKSATAERDSQYWTAGAAYENGPYGISVTYLDSQKGTGTAASGTVDTGTSELKNVVVGADYQMAPGLVPYVEASFFQFDNGSTNGAFDTDGTAVIVGANLAF